MRSDLAAEVEAQVIALEPLDLFQLREVWRARYGCPPKLRSADLLRLCLAWRIQAAAFGGLDAATRQKLRRGAGAGDAADRLEPGVRLLREWRGDRHEVVVGEDGAFIYQGARYASLSVIARRITGGRINGPRFFGLRADTRPAESP